MAYIGCISRHPYTPLMPEIGPLRAPIPGFSPPPPTSIGNGVHAYGKYLYSVIICKNSGVNQRKKLLFTGVLYEGEQRGIDSPIRGHGRSLERIYRGRCSGTPARSTTVEFIPIFPYSGDYGFKTAEEG
jgi:hypothetical protein